MARGGLRVAANPSRFAGAEVCGRLAGGPWSGDWTRAGSVAAVIDVTGGPLLDASTLVGDGPDERARSMSNVEDGGTVAEPALVPGVTVAVGRPAAATDDNSAGRDQHTIPRIATHIPAVLPSHKMSPASLSWHLATIGSASVGIDPLLRGCLRSGNIGLL